MGLSKGLMKVVAPEMDDVEEALQKSLPKLAWANKSSRNPVARSRRPARIQHQETSDISQPEPELRRRATSPSDAEVSKFLRDTRTGHQRRETSPDSRRDNPIVHPQPRRVSPNMAGTRRTGYLEVAAANTQRITPHQVFLKGQVKRQQDATDEWARRNGKSAPPYQFEDFIGKGAYGRVFRA